MKKEIKDKSASVRAKLFNISKKSNIEFDALLLRYLQERFLYRLTISEYPELLILKGGYLLVSFNLPWSRATKDIDFLAIGIKNTTEELEKYFKKVAEINVDDGAFFDSSSTYSERIIENSDYVGIRLKINASLGKAKKILQFDIGFGDVIWPEASIIELPTLLDTPAPKLKVYSKETVIAEKFEIMIKREIMNSRMKDFFDIYSLSYKFNLEGKILQKAIESTLIKRQTPLIKTPVVFKENFSNDKSKQVQWKGFLKNTRINNIDTDFREIIIRITKFLKPIVLSIMDKKKMEQSWDAEKGIWN